MLMAQQRRCGHTALLEMAESFPAEAADGVVIIHNFCVPLDCVDYERLSEDEKKQSSNKKYLILS